MKGLKRQRKILETAPSIGEPENNIKPLRDRDRSRTDVSSISCLSMKSDFSRGQPPHFSSDPPDNDCECPNNTQRPLHRQKFLLEAGQMPGHSLKDHLPKQQGDEGLLEEVSGDEGLLEEVSGDEGLLEEVSGLSLIHI